MKVENLHVEYKCDCIGVSSRIKVAGDHVLENAISQISGHVSRPGTLAGNNAFFHIVSCIFYKFAPPICDK